MPEYIEREALLEDLKLLAKHQQGERQQGILGACVTIQNRPTADVVEVVRCKDCEDYNGHRFCEYNAVPVLDDDFCSYGHRKEGAEE